MAINILIWMVVILVGIFYLFLLGMIGIIIVKFAPLIRKKTLLNRYGYEYDRDTGYWVNTTIDCSIPTAWWENWSYHHLSDYLERRASQ